MKQRVEIKNPVGINLSLDPADIAPNVWSDSSESTFRNGQSSRRGGIRRAFPANTDFSGQTLIQAKEGSNTVWYGFSATGIQRVKNGVTSDVTRASGGPYTGNLFDTWSATNLNTVIVSTNGINTPQSKLESQDKFQDLPNWPSNSTCYSMKAYKNFLVAMNITTSGTNYPSTVKWSSAADPGQVPFSWDVASITSDSGETYLSDSPGVILDGRSLRDSFVIYKESSVYSMNYIGGTYVFSFRKIFDDVGIIARDCVAEFEGGHFVVGRSDIYVHNGVQKSSVCTKIVKEFFYEIDLNKDFSNRCFVISDPSRSEIWVCYPNKSSNSAGLPNSALVWNWVDNSWTKRSVGNNVSAAIGILPSQDLGWSSQGTPWDFVGSPWSYQRLNTYSSSLVFSGGPTIPLEYTEESNDLVGSPTNIFFTTTFQKTGMTIENDINLKVLTSVTPHFFKGSGAIKITVGSHEEQNSPVVWKDPVVFNIGTDFKMDCRVTGRYLAVKFEIPSNITCVLTGFTGELETMSGRR